MHEINAVPPTKVTAGLTYKVNMGNYENLEIHFSVTDDLRPGEKAQAGLDRVYALVYKNLTEKVAEARG